MVVAVMVIGLDGATAHAAPPPDPGPAASCSFKLTPPSVVNVSGVDMVTAIMSPGECTGVIQPNSYTVCVEMLGSGTPQCKFTPVYDAVQVFFAPYRSGAAYASTARECGNVFPMGEQSCSSQGPYSRTL
jgi:hypothetical protein